MEKITHIAFDADDTLWVNEPYFRASEERFTRMLSAYADPRIVQEKLFETEMNNLDVYGYGVKGFILSMIETIKEVVKGPEAIGFIREAIEIGRAQLAQPIELLDGVEDVLQSLSSKYTLILATKGDLMEQEKKIEKSGLKSHFFHLEVMSNKKVANYNVLYKKIQVQADQLCMIGNSVKSDILPVIESGGKAIHIPYHTTWAHEEVNDDSATRSFHRLEHISQVLEYFDV